MDKDKKLKWYDSGNNITTCIIIIVLLTIICSQAFAVVGSNTISIIASVISHNTIYLLISIYFIGLKTYIGKKYFNYLNVFLMFIYFVLSVTSFLTVIQSFSLNTVLSFSINVIVLIYLFHTMFRDTRVWKEFKLGNSPFNEITNDFYFNTLVILVIISLFVNLISTVVLSGLVISILNALYITFLGRYIYLYRDYLDKKRLDINNKGNFDNLRKEVKEDLEEISGIIKDKTEDTVSKVNETIKETKDNLEDIGENIKDKTEDVVSKVSETIKETKEDIKDKINKDTTSSKKVKKSNRSKKGDK